MSEINITRFFKEAAPMDYSASVAEIGADAGPSTWRAACEDAPDFNFLDTEDLREDFREHVAEFGAWSRERIAAWTDVELNALFLQMVAGDMRDTGMDADSWDWAEYEKGAERGTWSGRIFRADSGDVYYYIGS